MLSYLTSFFSYTKDETKNIIIENEIKEEVKEKIDEENIIEKNIAPNNDFNNLCEYKLLRYLLLNDYDNNMFLTPQILTTQKTPNYNESFSIWGIRNINDYNYLVHKDRLFEKTKNIYIIVNGDYSFDNIYNYIKNSGVSIEIFKCDLFKFVEKYPEFKHSHYNTGYNDFHDWISCKNPTKLGSIYNKSFYLKDLPACQVLPNLIVGEGLNFMLYKHNFYKKEKNYDTCLKYIEIMKNHNISCVINVGLDCSYDYFDDLIELFKENNIDVFNLPIFEYPSKSMYEIDRFHEVSDIINEYISKNKNVYLHCFTGRNMSVCCAMLYMVKHLNMTIKNAFQTVGLKKYIHPQIQLIRIIYDEALKKESNPISLHKLICDRNNMFNQFESSYVPFATACYDLYMLDVIAGRQNNPIIV